MTIPSIQPNNIESTSVDNTRQFKQIKSILTKNSSTNHTIQTSNQPLGNHGVTHGETSNVPENKALNDTINSLARNLSSGLSGGIKGFFQQLIAWFTNPGDWETASLIAAVTNLSSEKSKETANIVKKLTETPEGKPIADKLLEILSKTVNTLNNFIKLLEGNSIAEDSNILKSEEFPKTSDIMTNNPAIFNDTQSLPKSLSEKQKKALNASREKEYSDSTQAKLVMELFYPDEWEKSQSSKQEPSVSIDCNDIYLARNIDDSKNLDDLYKSITPELFEQLNAENDEAFNKFYIVFKNTLLCKDVIARNDCGQITFGEEVWTRKEYQNSDLQDPNQKCTKDLLKTIYTFCGQNPQKACKFLPNFIKQFHASGNSIAPIGMRIFSLRPKENLATTISSDTYNFHFSVTVDEKWNMYSSIQGYIPLLKDMTQACVKNLTAQGYKPTDETYGIISVETKVDLLKEVHPDESDVAKDMQSSAYIKIFLEKNTTP